MVRRIMRAARDPRWLAKSPYLLWLALAAFAVGCIVLVRVQAAPAARITGLLVKDCWVRAGGAKMFIGDQRCYRTLPQRRICGVWMSGFEESLFLHDVNDLTHAGVIYYENLPWLDVARDATGLPATRDGAAYRICFLGRDSHYFGAYGHAGVAHTGVLLEKVETIREIPIPKDLKMVVPGVTN